MPEALQVSVNVKLFTIVLIPLILTEEGGARGPKRISSEHKHGTSNNILVYMSCTVTRADL